jgi:cholest-4-en-3-one 26-monooxygenase
MPDASAPRAPLEIIDPEWYGAHGQPRDAWARLRRSAPVAYCEPSGMLPFWAITRHDDIVRISRDPERFLNAPRLAVFPEEQFETENFPVRHLLNMDPPEHRHYRRLLSAHFTPRALEAKRAPVEQLIDEILDGVAGRRAIDFVTDVAAVMPIAVIAEMLGLPVEDRPLFFRWTNETLGATDPEYQQGTSVRETTNRAVVAQKEYFARMIELRRREPTDDFIGLLANARLDGEWIPDFELLSYLILLVVAGNETTRNAASGGLLALIENPGELAKLRRNPQLVPLAVEEIVRWVTPVNQFCRTPVADSEIRGQRIRAGEQLCLFYGSANRDEAFFDDPSVFRVDRDPNPHIAFGIGEHVCLGAHLARLELQLLFRKLVERLDELEPAGAVERLQSSFINGIKHLPVRMTLRQEGKR